MKNRGLIFSLSVLFLILSFVLLSQTATRTNLMQEKTFSALKAYQALSDYYHNVARNITELDTKGSFGIAQQRMLPFKYSADENRLSLEFNAPMSQGVLGKYFDSVNAFKIFLEDANYSNYYHGIDATVSTVKNAAWGGADTALNFVVEPSCMNIAAQETGIAFSRGWCANFDLNSTVRIDVNVTINTSNEDLNRLSCFWDGNDICPNNDFNLLDPNPYFSLKVFDENCSSCSFTLTEVKGHFDISQNNWASISCQGSNCNSKQIDLNLSDSFVVKRSTDALAAKINTEVLLKNSIEKFYFNDLNLTLSIDDYNLTMETPR